MVALFNIELPQDEGYLAKILVGDGAKDIPVGTLVAIVVDDKDDVRTGLVHDPAPARACSLRISRLLLLVS